VNVPASCIELVKFFESFYPRPYLCPAGVWTIGYGTTRYPDGRPVAKDDPPISEPLALSLMTAELERGLMSALAYSPVLARWPDSAGAIASFIYNLGASRYYASTLRRRINQQDWRAAKTEIQRWVYSKGRKLPGLVIRRRKEAELLLAGPLRA
jgi:lysozyme